MRILHVVNPVKVTSKSDLFIAQPITFASMANAKQYAEGQNKELKIQLATVSYPEDELILPEGFYPFQMLERSVIDVGKFEKSRKLPILNDIVQRALKESDADYVIYTNVDIAVLPHFYLTVASLISQGFDGLIINRRTISGKYSSVEELPLMYAEIGIKHFGHDCFIFRRDAIKDYDLGVACIGVEYIGKIMLLNLVCHATKFMEVKAANLTFHIGNEKSWYSKKPSDFALHNHAELVRIWEKFETEGRIPDHRLAKICRPADVNNASILLKKRLLRNLSKAKHKLRGQPFVDSPPKSSFGID